MRAHQFDEEDGHERAVNHQARIALAGRGIIAVVVDPMSIESQGREAEKQGRVGRDRARPRTRRRRGSFLDLGGGDRSAGFAIDDVLLLLDAGPAGLLDLMPDGDERQSSGPSRLFGDLANDRVSTRGLADRKRPQEARPGPREHPSRQVEGRHEPAALGVAVEAEPRLGDPR